MPGRHRATDHLSDYSSDAAREFLEFGARIPEADYEAAQKQRRHIAKSYKRFFKETGVQALLTPTLGCEAFEHHRTFPEWIHTTRIEPPWLDWAAFLYDANLIGMPACAIPMGVGSEGLPISAQILGPKKSDPEVLNIAEQIEALVGWQHPFARDDAAFSPTVVA